MTTLIFPSSHSAAYAYYQQAMMNGEEVVCASSMAYDDTAYLYKTWFRLPSIYDLDFHDELWSEIINRDIDKIYCPSTQVYEFLDTLDLWGAKLIGKSPAVAQAEYYKDLIKQADKSLEFIDSIYQDNLLGKTEIAALLRQTSFVYGESHSSKFLAMAAIFADAPEGGIVEIGALLGKTALALGMLANWSSFTDIFIVDSWCPSPQKDSPQQIQDIADLWDWKVVYEGFKINTAILPSDIFHYCCYNSIDAHKVYTWNNHPKISILHIDANHDYDQVKQDYDLWRPHVLPGGWLILDDYVWFHGDGPKRVGDAALENENIERAFTCGGALFMKFPA